MPKKRKSQEKPRRVDEVKKANVGEDLSQLVKIRLVNESGEQLDKDLDVQVGSEVALFQAFLNGLKPQEEAMKYSFYVGYKELNSTLFEALKGEDGDLADGVLEGRVDVLYRPQANFRVFAVNRCTGSLRGHTGSIQDVHSSPDGRHMASASVDCTVRFWDILTETPKFECKGHNTSLMYIVFSPCGRKLASADFHGEICIWDPVTGAQKGKKMVGHRKTVVGLCWKPLHLDASCRYLASCSQDCTIKIWDTVLSLHTKTLSGHEKLVSAIKWTGDNLIYSSSHDTSIKVWDPEKGILIRSLKCHTHWVNNLCTTTDFTIRTATFDPQHPHLFDPTLPDEELQEIALKRYEKEVSRQSVFMAACSDDHTISLWDITACGKKPVARMSGHQQVINDINFSPNAQFLASASFDKSLRLWDGRSGDHIATLRGHIGQVFQVCWSADSRLLCSCSADKTLKVWNTRGEMIRHLTQHEDKVEALDWCPNGERVISGSNDHLVSIWKV